MTITKITTLSGSNKKVTYTLTIKNVNNKKDKHDIKLDEVPMELIYMQMFLQEALEITW